MANQKPPNMDLITDVMVRVVKALREERDQAIARLEQRIVVLEKSLDAVNRLDQMHERAMGQVDQHDAVLLRIEQRLAALTEDRPAERAAIAPRLRQ